MDESQVQALIASAIKPLQEKTDLLEKEKAKAVEQCLELKTCVFYLIFYFF